MKRALITLLALGLLALSCAAFADGGGYGSQYSTTAYQGIRVQAGWAKPTDVDSALIWGASYIWKQALLSVNYFDADASLPHAGSVQALSVEGTYLWRPSSDPSWYYGAGYGLVFADAGENTTSGMWNLVVGKEFNSGKDFGKPGLFVEGRWNLGSHFDTPRSEATGASLDPSLDGPRIQVGWQF
jgi:hypothetical protein